MGQQNHVSPENKLLWRIYQVVEKGRREGRSDAAFSLLDGSFNALIQSFKAIEQRTVCPPALSDYRERAAIVRSKAKSMTDRETVLAMMDIAQSWEGIAQTAERLHGRVSH